MPKDYIVYTGKANVCFVCIDDAGSLWILGDSFLRGFYSVYDHKEKRFGFAPHSTSDKIGLYKSK